jgi:hypothetical protein
VIAVGNEETLASAVKTLRGFLADTATGCR